MTKKEIIKYSGCVRNAVVASVFSMCGLIAMILSLYVFKNEQSVILTIIGIMGTFLFFTATTLAIKEVPIIRKIIKEQYEIKTCELISIKFRRPFAAGADNERSLEFAKFKLTVDKYVAEKYKVGDKIVMVFLNDIKYPIIIRKVLDTNGQQ